MIVRLIQEIRAYALDGLTANARFVAIDQDEDGTVYIRAASGRLVAIHPSEFVRVLEQQPIKRVPWT